MEYEIGKRLDVILENQKVLQEHLNYIIKVFDDNGIGLKEEKDEKKSKGGKE